MKKLFIIATVCLVFASVSCKKEQQIKPKSSSLQSDKQAQTTYNYQEAIMAKHTIN